jgi:hypothetical protein
MKTIGRFLSLSDMELQEDCSIDLYKELRQAFEHTYPDFMIDASDADIITVFPFKLGGEIPDEYDVVNFAVGMIDGFPALCKMDDSQELLLLKNAKLVTFTGDNKSIN